MFITTLNYRHSKGLPFVVIYKYKWNYEENVKCINRVEYGNKIITYSCDLMLSSN